MIWWLISTGHELKADFFLHHNERRGSSHHSLFSTLKIISTGGPISFFFELVALWLVGESFWVIRLLELSVFYLKFISGPMIFKVDKETMLRRTPSFIVRCKKDSAFRSCPVLINCQIIPNWWMNEPSKLQSEINFCLLHIRYNIFNWL